MYGFRRVMDSMGTFWKSFCHQVNMQTRDFARKITVHNNMDAMGLKWIYREFPLGYQQISDVGDQLFKAEVKYQPSCIKLSVSTIQTLDKKCLEIDYRIKKISIRIHRKALSLVPKRTLSPHGPMAFRTWQDTLHTYDWSPQGPSLQVQRLDI